MCISSQHHLQHELQKSASAHSFGGLPHSHSFSGRIVFDQTTSSIVTSNEMVRSYFIFFQGFSQNRVIYQTKYIFVLYFPQFTTQIYQNLTSYAYFLYIEDYMRRLFTHPPPKKNVISVDICALYGWKSVIFSNKQFLNIFFYLNLYI